MPSSAFFFILLHLLGAFPRLAVSRSTVDPCVGSDACAALVGYTLYADLKVSEVADLFQVDPAAVLAANAFDASLPEVEDRILPAGLFLRIPINCICADAIRKCVSVRYVTRPDETLSFIAGSIYAGLVSADQIREANGITDPEAVESGRKLAVPLPCFCFNSSINGLPAVYLSYVIRAGDTVQGIAAAFSTTVAYIMKVNAIESPSLKPDDIIAIPLLACASTFQKYSSDYGLTVANGSYTITANRCLQCTCGPESLNLYCMPASFTVSCSSMQCRNSKLIIGNAAYQLTSAGCSISSCSYEGFVNGSIITKLSNSLQPKCPGPHKFPAFLPIPEAGQINESILAPSPSTLHSRDVPTIVANSSVPTSEVRPGLSPRKSPAGNIPKTVSKSTSLIGMHLRPIDALTFCLLLGFLL